MDGSGGTDGKGVGVDDDPRPRPPSFRPRRRSWPTRWLLAGVVILAVGVTTGIVVQRGLDADVRRAASIQAFHDDVSIGPGCGTIAAVEQQVDGKHALTYEWSEGRQLYGTITVHNGGGRDIRIERLDVVWERPLEHSVPLTIGIEPAGKLIGCVPRPIGAERRPLPHGPITLSPGESASFEYSLVMGRCRGISPGATFGGDSPFHWTITRDGERFEFAAGVADELSFRASQDGTCSPSAS